MPCFLKHFVMVLTVFALTKFNVFGFRPNFDTTGSMWWMPDAQYLVLFLYGFLIEIALFLANIGKYKLMILKAALGWLYVLDVIYIVVYGGWPYPLSQVSVCFFFNTF